MVTLVWNPMHDDGRCACIPSRKSWSSVFFEVNDIYHMRRALATVRNRIKSGGRVNE